MSYFMVRVNGNGFLGMGTGGWCYFGLGRENGLRKTRRVRVLVRVSKQGVRFGVWVAWVFCGCASFTVDRGSWTSVVGASKKRPEDKVNLVCIDAGRM